MIMGQKVSPISLRLGVHRDWRSRWFSTRQYSSYLKEDIRIRKFLENKLKGMSVHRIEIERSPDVFTIIVNSARPGLIIGRSGTGIEELKKQVSSMIKRKTSVRVEVQEFKQPELSSAIMAEIMVEQLEKRIPFRRVLKQAITKILANRDVKGVKLAVAGRLNGAAIARTEHMEEGSLPLQTLRALIDYKKATAHTTYGSIGIKVWIYTGMKF